MAYADGRPFASLSDADPGRTDQSARFARAPPNPACRPLQRRAVTIVVQALSSFGRSRCGAMRTRRRLSSPRTTGQ